MSDPVKQVAMRILDLREISDYTVDKMAEVLNVPVEEYRKYESGEVDMPISFLVKIGEVFHVDMTELLTGEAPRLNVLSVTRAGRGQEETSCHDQYVYRNLAYNFVGRKIEPMYVVVDPEDNKTLTPNSHDGQEFDYILSGTMHIVIGKNDVVLHPGDSVYYDSRTPLLMTSKWMEPKTGSTGRPSPAYDIALVDENGQDVDDGVEGEIVIRLDKGHPAGLFLGYYRNQEQTDAVFYNGMYHTGDMAWRDVDGYYNFIGRSDDVIKSSGYRIGPFEVESALLTHPAVLECAVTAVPHPDRGQVVKATVVLVKNRGYEPTDALKKELQNHVKQVTAPYKYPRIVEFVDELPKTVSGKIQRKLIRRTDADTGADRLTVRPATPDDAVMTLSYLAQIAGESDNLSFGAEGLDMNVEQERGYIEGITGRSLLLLGFIGDELAAMGALKCMRRERARHRASLSVTVRKKYWHRGIGTQMVSRLIEHARQGGISVIELEVRSDNVSAISLCQKMGFERIGVYPKFFRINGRDYDADLMNLYL